MARSREELHLALAPLPVHSQPDFPLTQAQQQGVRESITQSQVPVSER
ncbi:Uncharacterised protein [Vibrio cholerae]|nr:Uncharacterised protein [Vibrio cholerae]